MAHNLFRNMFFQFIRIRYLHSSVTLSSISPLPTSATCSSPSHTVDFLVNSFGLSSKSALSVSKKFKLNEKKTPQKLQSVLQFLKSHHFSNTQVAQLIVRRPQVLNCRIHNNLKPKFEYLMKIGFEGELLSRIILSYPKIMERSLVSRIKRSVQSLRLFLGNDEKFLMAVKRGPWLLSENRKIQLQRSFDVLLKEGVPAHVFERFLILQPMSMLLSPHKLVSAVNSLKNLGFDPSDAMFIQALRVMIGMSDSTWKKKIEVMKSMGFCEEDTLKAFKRFPKCLSYSEENIRKTLDFYFNTMKFEPQTIIANPTLLGYSIEKSIHPRYHVLKVLESKKLVKGIKWLQHIKIGEEKFREKYIDQFIDEVPGLLEIYLDIKEAKSPLLE